MVHFYPPSDCLFFPQVEEIPLVFIGAVFMTKFLFLVSEHNSGFAFFFFLLNNIFSPSSCLLSCSYEVFDNMNYSFPVYDMSLSLANFKNFSLIFITLLCWGLVLVVFFLLGIYYPSCLYKIICSTHLGSFWLLFLNFFPALFSCQYFLGSNYVYFILLVSSTDSWSSFFFSNVFLGLLQIEFFLLIYPQDHWFSFLHHFHSSFPKQCFISYFPGMFIKLLFYLFIFFRDFLGFYTLYVFLLNYIICMCIYTYSHIYISSFKVFLRWFQHLDNSGLKSVDNFYCKNV